MLARLRLGRLLPFIFGIAILLSLVFTLYNSRGLESLKAVVPWQPFDNNSEGSGDSSETGLNNGKGESPILSEEEEEKHDEEVEAGATDPPLPPLETIKLPTIEEDGHPIIELLHEAEVSFKGLLKGETYNLASAARKYRERRGRHPPPGFDKWWKYARDHEAMIIEEFWDQIYEDLNPLWALNTKDMWESVREQGQLFTVRNGTVEYDDHQFWMPIWAELIMEVVRGLPDMVIAVNTMDEPRLWIPWEDMAIYVEKEQKERKMVPADEVVSVYSGIPKHPEKSQEASKFPWNGTYPIWPKAVAPCAPDSAARQAEIQKDWSQSPIITNIFTKNHTYKGYVSNYTLSTSICHQPDLQGLHGYLIEPLSVRNSRKLFPLFGSSKLGVNSEILFPAAMYYTTNSAYTANEKEAEIPWEEKGDTMVWRGLASGGRNKAENWKGFHRHRLISMLNGTQSLLIPQSSGFIDVDNLPLEQWNLATWSAPEERHIAMGNWLQNWSSPCGFTNLNCFPSLGPNFLGCEYTDYLFRPLEQISMAEQHSHKYLVDIDGNSFSGRYRDFLLSGSLPIKATIFREWHDSRLVAWKHFVPFDNRYLDIYGIMEFFLGYPVGVKGRDHLAQKIAEEGRDWAKKVLRREDMRIYTYRLLLEYARVMDEKRDVLGWVEDLVDAREGGVR